MNKGKKWFLILCAWVLAFSALAGCGNDQGATWPVAATKLFAARMDRDVDRHGR